MIEIFKTGLFDFSDLGVDKPVKFTINELQEIASRNAFADITREHSNEVIGRISNFIVDKGFLKTEKPADIDLKGMGLSPLFEVDQLIDCGDYYKPQGINMPKIGYTKTPRTHILYNSVVSNSEDKIVMSDDTELRKALKRNDELIQEIGVLKSQMEQLNRSNKKYKKEVEEFQESNSNIIQLKQENETLKEKADKLDAYLQGEKAELVHSLAGDNEALMKEYENIPVEHLRVFKKNMSNIENKLQFQIDNHKQLAFSEEDAKDNGYSITYTPPGQKTQTYTIRGSHIYNSAGKEVFTEEGKHRNRIFANLAVQQGRAVVVEHKGRKYVVNNKDAIISVTTGDKMNWSENNGDRKAIVELAKAKFNSMRSNNPTQPIQTTTSSNSNLVITGDSRSTAQKAKELGGIDTLRHPDANGMHFGNPFSHTNYQGV